MRTFPGCTLVASALALSVAGLSLVACDPPLPEATLGDPCSSDDKASTDYFFGTMVPQVFDPYCSFCHSVSREGEARHGAPDSLNYDSFGGATSQVYLTWERVRTRNMPPMGRTPSTEEVALLADWLNCVTELPDGDAGDDDSAGDGDDDDSTFND